MPTTIRKLQVKDLPLNSLSKLWVHVINNGLGEPIRIPVVVARGKTDGPTMGLTAALHGNELNGIPVIHDIVDNIDTETLTGNIVGVFAMNVPGVLMGQRRFNDDTDLNRIAPGSAVGNESAIYIHRVIDRIVNQFDYLIDLHTASFGRKNSYYIRADMSDKVTARMAMLQGPDIILNNPPNGTTLRGWAASMGIKSMTIELKDPHLFQYKVIQEAAFGIRNVLTDLGFFPGKVTCPVHETIFCKNSKWIFTDEGGILHVLPHIGDRLHKGQKIAEVKSIFGDMAKEFFAPEDGIVIGKSVDPINQTGSRVLHLGLEPEVYPCTL